MVPLGVQQAAERRAAEEVSGLRAQLAATRARLAEKTTEAEAAAAAAAEAVAEQAAGGGAQARLDAHTREAKIEHVH